jgi:hypothetical protein
VVAFVSGATDLVGSQVDSNGGWDVFAYRREAGTLTLVSRADTARKRAGQLAGSVVATGNSVSSVAVLSDDGRVVGLESLASDLTGDDDGNGFPDVFAASLQCGDRRCPGRASR